MQWEFQVLRVRAECGELCRVLEAEWVAEFEIDGPLPERVSLCGRTLYRTLYADGVPVGAIRFTDPGLIGRYERFAGALYASGEDLDAYFERELAPLTPPGPGSAR